MLNRYLYLIVFMLLLLSCFGNSGYQNIQKKLESIKSGREYSNLSQEYLKYRALFFSKLPKNIFEEKNRMILFETFDSQSATYYYSLWNEKFSYNYEYNAINHTEYLQADVMPYSDFVIKCILNKNINLITKKQKEEPPLLGGGVIYCYLIDKMAEPVSIFDFSFLEFPSSKR